MIASGPRAKRVPGERQRQQRRASRTAHRGLSKSAALALAKDTFGEVVLRPAWKALSLQPGEKLTGYVGDRVARVEREGGPPGLVESTLPLRAKDEQGRLAPVDLTLGDAGAALEPVNALVGVSIAERASGGVGLPDAGVRVQLVGASAQSDAELVGGQAFFAGVGPDADLLITPRPGGL